MSIEITPEDLTPPAGMSENDIENSIEVGMAYARLIAPCIESLEGDRAILAKALLIKAINYRFMEPVTVSGRVEIGPFKKSEEAEASYFPSFYTKQLKALCGKSSTTSVLTLNSDVFRRYPKNWDFVSNHEWSE